MKRAMRMNSHKGHDYYGEFHVASEKQIIDT